jgi:thioredoxin reductase
MTNVFDVGIVGMGVAGALATLKLSKEHKNLKVIGFDIGRPPAKRKRQIEGWLGCLTTSDGKLYLNDLDKVAQVTGSRPVKKAHKWFNKTLSNVNNFKIVKDRAPNVSVEKRLKKIGYDITLNNYIQMYPKDIHTLSKQMAETIEQNNNITFKFDNEVIGISKQKNTFVIKTEDQEYRCKKLIIAAGRSGWRWVSKVFANFGIIDNNDIARFGIRVETTSLNMKEFNKSNCTIVKGDVELGPFSWSGTVIPEDHLDLAISAFRSNETRWHTDKVSFNLIGSRPFPNAGFEQTDRVGKLSFILSNDRIIKERVSAILADKSKISLIKEYGWLKEVINELALAVPEIATKAYFYVPTIIPAAPQIILGNNLESEISGMFVVGESAGLHGILAAAVSGLIAADAVCK